MHVLVIGAGAEAAAMASAACRSVEDEVTFIRSAVGSGPRTPSAVPVQKTFRGRVTIEHDTFATYIDCAGQAVWVQSGEHEEVIYFDLLIVCVGLDGREGCASAELLPGLGRAEEAPDTVRFAACTPE